MNPIRNLYFRRSPGTLLLVGCILLSGCNADDPVEPSPVCTYAIAPVQFSPCMRSQELTVTIDTQAACPWTVSPSADWLRLLSNSSGTGPAQVRARTDDNWDLPRVGELAVRWPPATAGENVRIAQAGCHYGVSPGVLQAPAVGGTLTFEVVQQTDPLSCGGPIQNACLWTATPMASWIAVTTPMPRTGDDRVTVVVGPNTTGAERSGTIVVRSQTVLVIQAP